MATTSTPIISKVGDLALTLALNPPAGFLSLGEGLVLNRIQYSELWTWAQNTMKIISESEWQDLANAQDGNCGFFSSGDGSTTFRLPKITSLLKMSELAEVGNYNKSEYSNLHFHGLGRMQNNNGNWGRYGYSGAKYPSGTSGWFWNGSGGTGTSGGPDSSGDIIISYNINVGTSGNGELADSTNIGIAIRAYHPEAVATIARTAELKEAIAIANITALNINDDGMATADAKSNPDNLGWYYETDGTLETWGTYETSIENRPTIIYTQSMNTNAIHISLRNRNPKSSDPVLINFDATKMTINLGDYTPGDIIEYVVHGY